ncbi:homocysteine biosynthesis protein [Anthocerotibacter panamensis]|uniref:homocysteine biosynthesis protein n=1 Tax=Anthocerotibacter panamensis TaxID=2857077 RepID=UPI001C4045FB|nr:homocysteine biosynthesis protein [Anthocerotibacter panamensis]
MTLRTLDQINNRIQEGTVTVLTAHAFKQQVQREGLQSVAQRVDVVTVGSFEVAESAGAFFNLGHPDPPLRMQQVWLNDVEGYCGFGAVDFYLGAAKSSSTQEWRYGGGHVIEQLIRSEQVRLRATGYPNDCHPLREFDTLITKDTINQFYLYMPRGLYQNFIVGVNGGDRPLYTFLGTLQPRLGNAIYASGGAFSPLLNDPYLSLLGVGSRIWLGGAIGYVAWEGTQHFPLQKRLPNGTPVGPAATLALIGDCKAMDARWVRGCRLQNYGTGLMVGVGLALPVLDLTAAQHLAVTDQEVVAPVVDFAIPRRVRPVFDMVNYAQLKSGKILINGQAVRTAPLSSLYWAQEIAAELKGWVEEGRFMLHTAVAPLPLDQVFLSQEGRTAQGIAPWEL